MGKDRVLELLEAVDWNDIILKLTYYAIWRAHCYIWKSGDPNRLPKGKTPEDIAIEAIKKVWEKKRGWDPDKYPDLLVHLKWIVKSDIEHLFSSMEHQKTGRIPTLKDDEETGPSYDEIVRDSSSHKLETTSTPEEELIAQEDRRLEEKLKNELYTAIKGDADLELLLLCFEEGIDKPEEIAGQTGWEVKKVYTLKKKLFRKASKIDTTLDKSK